MRQYKPRNTLGIIYDTAKYVACVAVLAIAGCGKKPSSAHADFIRKNGKFAGYDVMEDGTKVKTNAILLNMGSDNNSARFFAKASENEVTLSKTSRTSRELKKGSVEETKLYTEIVDDLRTPGYDSGTVSKMVFVETSHRPMSPTKECTFSKTVTLSGKDLEEVASSIFDDLEARLAAEVAKVRAENDKIKAEAIGPNYGGQK